MCLKGVHASAVTPRPVAFQRTAAFDAVEALPIRAGKDRLGVTVRIVWSFA